MSLILMEGFNHESNMINLLISKGWTSNYFNSAISVAGRFSSYAIGSYGSNWPPVEHKHTIPQNKVIYCGFAYYKTDSTAVDIINFYDSTTKQCKVVCDATGKVYFKNGADTVTYTDTLTSSVRLRTIVWEFIEVMVTIDNSIGINSCIIKINGVEVSNLTSGQDTQATANAYIDNIGLYLNNNIILDDLYVCDANGAANNTFLGDCRIAQLLPAGNGNYSQFVGSDSNSADNYLLIDETVPNTSDYVQSSTVGQQDSYAFGNLDANAGTVYGIQSLEYAIKSDTGIRKISPLTRLGGVDYLGTEQDLSASWNYTNLILEVDPSTSAAWNKTNIDNAEFGFKVTT